MKGLEITEAAVEEFMLGCFGYRTDDEAHRERIRSGLQAAIPHLLPASGSDVLEEFDGAARKWAGEVSIRIDKAGRDSIPTYYAMGVLRGLGIALRIVGAGECPTCGGSGETIEEFDSPSETCGRCGGTGADRSNRDGADGEASGPENSQVQKAVPDQAGGEEG